MSEHEEFLHPNLDLEVEEEKKDKPSRVRKCMKRFDENIMKKYFRYHYNPDD